jgi:hypothetical protein
VQRQQREEPDDLERLTRELEEAFEEEGDDDGEDRPSVNVHVHAKRSSRPPTTGIEAPRKSIIPPLFTDTTKKRIAFYVSCSFAIIVAIVQGVRELIQVLKISP